MLMTYSPGRFFAANQLKLLLAQIVTNYEIEPIAVRPENKWLNNTIGPPIFDSIRIRRRPGTAPEAVPIRVDSAMPSPSPEIRPVAFVSGPLIDQKMLESLTDGLRAPGSIVEAV
jgi:hypothetical protein